MPSGSVVPLLLTAHERPVQTGCGKVTVGPLLPAGSLGVVAGRVTGVPARPHAADPVTVGPLLPAGSLGVVAVRVTGVPAWPHASYTVRVTVWLPATL